MSPIEKLFAKTVSTPEPTTEEQAIKEQRARLDAQYDEEAKFEGFAIRTANFSRLRTGARAGS